MFAVRIPATIEEPIAAPKVCITPLTPAAFTQRRRHFPRRRPRRRARLRARRGPPPRLTPLRRTLGTSVARSRALRRLPRFSTRRSPRSLALSRLGSARDERRPPLRPIHRHATRR